MKWFLQWLTVLVCFVMLQAHNIAWADENVQAAFVRGGNLWVKNGEAEQQVTTDGNVTNPVWSHDGNMIAYQMENDLWVYRVQNRSQMRVYHSLRKESAARNIQWAPDKNAIAFQIEKSLELTDLQYGDSARRRSVAGGVDHFSWTPDGKAFLASSQACPRPDGWSSPLLFTIPWDATFPSRRIKAFYTIPKELVANGVGIISIGTTGFKWSPDSKWIAFIVTPTASWSMDSNMLCVISADGKTFKPLGEMLHHEKWFKWSPQKNVLGYIAGGGRFVLASPKKLTLHSFPTIQSRLLTPPHFNETSFTWHDDHTLTVARMPEYKWSNDPKQRPLPSLYQIHLQEHRQQQITTPPAGYGDTEPHFVRSRNRLTWVRYNRQTADVWIADADGADAKVWIHDLQTTQPAVEQDDWSHVLSIYDKRK